MEKSSSKPREQAELLLAKAAQDECVVDKVLPHFDVSDEIIGFHCQQAAEKLLKALLAVREVPLQRTHNLRQLMDLLVDDGCPLPEDLAELDVLTPFAAMFRYETPPVSAKLDRVATRQRISQLRRWVISQLRSE